MKKLLFIFFILFRQGYSQTYVLIPDPYFASYLQAIVPNAMSGNSLNITSTLVTISTKTINVGQQSITNLDGVQYFSSLEQLICHKNFLTSLPTLPTMLQSIICWDNKLTCLPSLPNSINYLDCSTNSLTSLPTLPTSLTYLNCWSNNLTSLPSLNNSLQILKCGLNPLTSLPTLNNSLITIDCVGCSISSLPNLPSSLQGLACSNNSLTTLPSLPNSLKDLYCYGNLISYLPPLPSNLTWLDCRNNSITCFPTFPSSINFIQLVPNPFTCLPNYIPAMSSTLTTTYSICNTPCTAGIEELNSNFTQFNIYPNPATKYILIETSNFEDQVIDLIALDGKILLSEKIKGKTRIDATNLSPGVYNLTLKTGKNNISKKLVIVH